MPAISVALVAIFVLLILKALILLVIVELWSAINCICVFIVFAYAVSFVLSGDKALFNSDCDIPPDATIALSIFSVIVDVPVCSTLWNARKLY